MSKYPCKQDIRPVDHASDPDIEPTQGIAHVAVSWHSGSGPGYHDGLDWHFYVQSGWEGCDPVELITQLRDTHIQADANLKANARAISFESEGTGDEPWDQWQVLAIIQLFQWMHDIDGVPLVMCPDWDQPGIGYHRLYNEWNKPYHSCPGDKKVAQFRDVILPALQKQATKGFLMALDDKAQATLLWNVNKTAGQVDNIIKALSTFFGGDFEGGDEKAALFDPKNGLYQKVTALQTQVDAIAADVKALAAAVKQ